MARRKATIIGPTDRFISDTHFSHNSMLTACARPYDTVEQMDRDMIAHWNSVVDHKTVVWMLGDFAWWKLESSDVQRIFSQLKGRKRLLVGNHDTDAVFDLPWEQVHHGVVIGLDKSTDTKIAMSHYPMREWPEFYSGAIHLHGHTHDNLPSSNRSWDCGVDHQGFMPLTLSDIQARMALLPNLDFIGIETDDFVPDRNRQKAEAEDATGLKV